MPTETEIKIRVKSHNSVRERLDALGARPIGRFIERNWILDNRDRSLASDGCALRVRINSDVGGARSGATLTFKGPRASGPFKVREELEIELDDGERMVQILSLLGVVPFLEYEKRRESWELNHCRVELDEPPYIGKFIEIEGPDPATIRMVQGDLGLADASVEPASYPELLIQFCEEHAIPGRVLRLG